MIADMGATTTYAWPTPNLADPANAPANFLTALQAVENTVKDTTRTTYTPAWTSEGSNQPFGASTRIGYYRVDHGICHVTVVLVGGAAVNGGTGILNLTAPLAATTAIRRQLLPLYYIANVAGGGVYRGFGMLTDTDGTLIRIYLPVSSGDNRLDRWRNAPEGGASGAGVPLVPGGYSFMNGSELVIQGSYYV